MCGSKNAHICGQREALTGRTTGRHKFLPMARSSGRSADNGGGRSSERNKCNQGDAIPKMSKAINY